MTVAKPVKPLRELPKETQLAIKRQAAELAMKNVKKLELAEEIKEHRAQIEKLKEG